LLGIDSLPDYQQNISVMYFIEVFKEGLEDIFEHVRDLLIVFVDYIQQIIEHDHLLLLLDDREYDRCKGDEVMVLVYAIEAAHKDQLLGLTHVLGIDTKIDSLAVFYKIFGHHRSDDGELVREVDIAGLHLVDVDELRASLDGDKVHVEHLLFVDAVPPLHDLKGMEDLIDLLVVDVEFLADDSLDVILIGVVFHQILVLIEDQFVSQAVSSLLVELACIFFVVLVDIVELG
jgi:hypothetical protein